MFLKIENLTDRPVIFQLNSGQGLHLAPYGSSEEIQEVEVRENAKVQKLQERRVIALHQVEEEREQKKDSTRSSKEKKTESTMEQP